VILETYHERIPFLISAPTMRVPMDVSETVNAYLAFRAAIRAVQGHNQSDEPKIETILCPGLCTAVGRMSPAASARQMHYAYGTSHLGQPWRFVALGVAVDTHHRMIG
jgi:O-acetyl-ADP-ribose deacetylase (regulator of RNase III)